MDSTRCHLNPEGSDQPAARVGTRTVFGQWIDHWAASHDHNDDDGIVTVPVPVATSSDGVAQSVVHQALLSPRLATVALAILPDADALASSRRLAVDSTWDGFATKAPPCVAGAYQATNPSW